MSRESLYRVQVEGSEMYTLLEFVSLWNGLFREKNKRRVFVACSGPEKRESFTLFYLFFLSILPKCYKSDGKDDNDRESSSTRKK